jgi:hypothetical protein
MWRSLAGVLGLGVEAGVAGRAGLLRSSTRCAREPQLLAEAPAELACIRAAADMGVGAISSDLHDVAWEWSTLEYGGLLHHLPNWKAVA